MTNEIQAWGAFDVNAAVHELRENESSQAFVKLEVGQNVLRILPPSKDGNSPFLLVHQHYVRLPGREKPLVYTCLKRMVRMECPICLQGETLQKKGAYEEAKEFWPRLRVFCAVVNRASPSAPQVLAVGKGVYTDILTLAKNPLAGGDFTHPVTGYDLIIHREGVGKNDTRYQVMPARPSVLSPDAAQVASWMQGLPDLSLYAVVKSAETIRAEIQAALRGEAQPPRGQAQFRPSSPPPPSTSWMQGIDDEEEDLLG